MAIPERLKVDFSASRKDLIADGLNKMLSVFYDSCTLRQFVAVLLRQVQELYDAALAVEEQRTLYAAEGVNLDALGRIVGQDRLLWSYNEDKWFHFDIEGQGWDQLPWWCRHGELGEYVRAGDEAYRTAVLSRAIKNHTLVAAVPELAELVELLLGNSVSFIKCGPNQVNLVVPEGITSTALWLLTHPTTDVRVDRTYYVPYPATLNFCEKIYFIPPNPFHFDREEPFQWDTAPWAVGVRYNWE